MYTQCPQCQIAFRVTAKVLQQAAGQVQCGGCGNGFNAVEHLSEEPPPTQQDAVKSSGNGAAESEPSFEERSTELLKALDDLAGPDEVRIEDTGIEWRVLSDEEQSDDIEHRTDSGSDATESVDWYIEKPGAAEPAATTEANGPVELLNAEAGLLLEEQEALDLEETQAAEPRYDDSTPLPDDYGEDGDEPLTPFVFTPSTAEPEPESYEESAELDDPQVDLALAEPDEWVDLLDEVVDIVGADVAANAAEAVDDNAGDNGSESPVEAGNTGLLMETEEELAAIHNELSSTLTTRDRSDNLDTEPPDSTENAGDDEANGSNSKAAVQGELAGDAYEKFDEFDALSAAELASALDAAEQGVTSEGEALTEPEEFAGDVSENDADGLADDLEGVASNTGAIDFERAEDEESDFVEPAGPLVDPSMDNSEPFGLAEAANDDNQKEPTGDSDDEPADTVAEIDREQTLDNFAAEMSDSGITELVDNYGSDEIVDTNDVLELADDDAYEEVDGSLAFDGEDSKPDAEDADVFDGTFQQQIALIETSLTEEANQDVDASAGDSDEDVLIDDKRPDEHDIEKELAASETQSTKISDYSGEHEGTVNTKIHEDMLRAMNDENFAASMTGEDGSPMIETIIMEGDFVRGSIELEPDNDLEGRLPTDLEEPKSLIDTYVLNRSGKGGRGFLSMSGNVMTTGIVVLVLLLAAQFIHTSRETLATFGTFNQTIGPVYRVLGKPVTPAWDVKGWQFETTNGSTDESEQLLTIYSSISNRSSQPLPYPLVHVSLTDRWEEIVGSRVLEPNEYLAGNPDPRRPVAGGDKFTAIISIATPSPEVTGFKLNICYRIDAGQLSCAIEDFKN